MGQLKSVIIDFHVIEDLGLTVNSYLYLLNLNESIKIDILLSEDEFIHLQKNLFIKVGKDNITLRQKSLDLINYLTQDSYGTFGSPKQAVKKSKRKISNDVDERIHEFRGLWKGLKPGSMGGLKTCKEKLTKWMQENPEYSFDDIIRAAQLYLNTERDLRFLQRADYFIYKVEANKVESSRLSAYIDDIDDNEQDDWMTQLN